jgi:hypothetical protein
MAKYASQFSSVTMSVTALGSGISTTGVNGFFGLVGGAAAQRCQISEVYMGGEAPSSSTVASMVLGRATTLASTATAGTATTIATDIQATLPASVPTAFTQWVTTAAPVVAAGAPILHLSFNAYGGIVRWVASPDQAITLLGASAYVVGTQGAGGELILTQIAGTAAAMSGHFLYEVV